MVEVEYQDFRIGKVNTQHTVAQEYTGTLGLSHEEVAEKSKHIIDDVKQAFRLKYFVDDYTGHRNFNLARDIYILSIIATIEGTSGITDKITFYQKGVKWGSRKHRRWNPMRADYTNGKTYLLENNETFKRLIIIENGIIIKEEELSHKVSLKQLTTISLKRGITIEKKNAKYICTQKERRERQTQSRVLAKQEQE